MTRLLLTNCRIVDTRAGQVFDGSVEIAGGLIQSVSSGRVIAPEALDLGGRFVTPGFIDGHVHIESSLLIPAEFAAAVAPHGTTAIVADPHEIANVAGNLGIEWLLTNSESLPVTFFFTASSCVPATDLETAGATLTATDIAELLEHPRIVGLGEMMNFPGVVAGSPEVLEKLMVARRVGKAIDGHAPGLSGDALRAYVAAGPDSDHECTRLDEAREKLTLDMDLMIREGSAAENLADLLPAVTDETWSHCMFVSDDKHPEDLSEQGHLDDSLRKAVALGLDPLRAVQLVTLTPALRFGLAGFGVLEPGARADLVVLDDLCEFHVDRVLKAGQWVVQNGRPVVESRLWPKNSSVIELLHTVHLPDLTESSFRIRAAGTRARVIGLTTNQLLTQCLEMDVAGLQGQVVTDVKRDILKLAVLERHGKTGMLAMGLVHGFGLREGALGSSVAHDSHNLVIVGADDTDMLAAARRLGELGGGLVAVRGGRVLAELPLPVAGLLSLETLETVCAQHRQVQAAAHELGAAVPNPFTALSFLSLPVIPDLKLTDKGLIWFNKTVGRLEQVSLFL